MALAKTSSTGKWSMGCLVLFALPFTGVGVGMAGWCAYMVMQYSAMQSWVEVPATITSAELKNGEDTDQAVAEYRYEFGGQKYTGKRVSIGGGSDNVGSFQVHAFRELKSHLDQRTPFHCYVNPKRPGDSILYRRLRGEMLAFHTLFGTLFGSVGFGLMWGASLAQKYAPAWKTDNVPSDRPWLVREDWARGEIRSNDKAATPVLTVVAVWWTIGSLPLVVSLPTIFQQRHNMWASMAWLFPAIGALLLAALAYLHLRNFTYGESVLQLASTPGVIGGQLAGVVRIAKPVTVPEGFRLSLTCLERRLSGDDTREESLWQDERILVQPLPDDAAGGTAVPFLFAIPYACEESSNPSATRTIEWRLKISARLPGVDYQSQFELPVFKTSDSQPDFKLDDQLAADFAARPPNDLLLGEAGILKEPLAGDGIRIVFGMARNPGPATAITAFLAVWCLGIAGMLQAKIEPAWPVGFSSLGLIVLFLALDMWFHRSVVEATREELAVRRGLFGIGRRRVFPAAEIREFTTSDNMTAGARVWKNIVVVLRSGKRRIIAKAISGKIAVDAVIDELNTALGRDEDKAPTTA